MSRLTKVSIRYYVREALLLMGLVYAIGAIFFIEMAALNFGESNDIEYLIMSVTMMCGMFMIMFSSMKNFYAANWRDSMVLSMGARRKDIFRGEIVKAFVYNLGCLLIGGAILIALKQYSFLGYLFTVFCISFPAGALGQALGYKVRKYGKIVLLVMIIVFAGFGGAASAAAAGSDKAVSAFGAFNTNIGIVAIVCGVLFVLLELWVYRLNKNCMVQ